MEAIKTLAGELRESGVVCVRNALDPKSLALAQAAFDWSLSHPSPAANRYGGGEGTFTRISRIRRRRRRTANC